MPISRIEVNEYQCALCGYKWMNRVNGKDGPIPKRCAKCKHQHWEKGKIDSTESAYRDKVKKRFGYWHDLDIPDHGGWRIEKNAMRYLASRPSIEEMKLLVKPMCYLYTNWPRVYGYKHASETGYVPIFADRKRLFLQTLMLRRTTFPVGKYVDYDETKKAHEYEKQLSRQLLKDFMIERGIPYDENEAKMQSLYSRHGKYATFMLRHVPELCNALKKDHPKWSNADIKAKVLKECSKELIWETTAFPEELIQSCWPGWLVI